MTIESAIALTVNGERRSLQIEARETLLAVLRDRLDLTGAKRACDRGECGACAVLVEDKPMLACNLLALQVRGRDISTVEGLASRPDFAPMLQAFVEQDGGQCGFCVPGFAVATYAALKHNASLNATELRWELVGHICRCNAYDRIAEAAVAAGERFATSTGGA
jgi:aerobic-type carbon monoxide dehydrogenase small subunit (CoxS/CutS family)